MGLLFFVFGYFTAQILGKKGRGILIRARFIRLGIPALLYVLVIGPLT